MTPAHGGNIFEISRERGWDWRDVADFSASINPLGPAPGVEPAIRAALDRIRHYPEREPARLALALSRLWHVEESQILLGNGATELLHFHARVERHDTVTLAVPVFSEFQRAYPQARCTPAANPEAWPRDGLLVLTQPNNPIGDILDPAVLESWLVRTTNPVLIDESFLEFTGLTSASRLLQRRPELYVLRSLTKFYALPGLRVGALLAAEDTIARWRPRREPWQVNVLAEEAALAAIADETHARRSLEFVAAERAWMLGELATLTGVHTDPSHANYLFVRLDYPSHELCQHMIERKILIRVCDGGVGDGSVGNGGVRVAIRTRAENERLLAAWREFRCAS
jgi:threonine-phosphate decarboxylase